MNVVFVAPYFTGNTHRALLSFLNLPGTQLSLISHDPLERVPESVRGRIVGHYQVRDSLDPDQLVEAGRYFQRKLGRVDRLIGFLEQMQVPLGQPGIAWVWRAWARPWRSTSARRTA